ncbi:MAG: hypothetical protein C0401_04560 [Anaerolinea sp.]|nr:hypothetical protein [Anaerolinea sp.]
MKNKSKKILSIILIMGVVITSALLALPTSTGYAASPINASASPNAKSGIPGSIVTYTVTIQNEDPANDATLTLEASTAGGWPAPTIVPSILTVLKSTSATVIVNVPVPAIATAGQNDIATVLIKEGVDIRATVQLTTTASSPVISGRPLVAVNSYTTGSKLVRAGQEFEMSLVLENRGQLSARNVVVTFDGAGFFPRSTGGVSTIGNIEPGGKTTFLQTFLVGNDLAWVNAAPIKATAVYTDPSGAPFTEVFNLTVTLASPVSSGQAVTATPKTTLKPQLVIIGNKTDVDPLQPGSIFELNLDVKNLGSADAKAVTMVLGGGVSSGGDSGTPQPGGVSGSGSELTNFAPLGSSNIVVVGDIKQAESASIKQKLVVNVTTQPGAYTLKISFVYTDPKGTRFVDDQVITLLVYSLPQVEINFYRDPGVFTVGMSNILPLQVTNLGKKSGVLGNMKVTAVNADVFNNVSLVGALEPGGYFTLDSELTPMQEGSLDIEISINYTDDFNQPRFITQTMTVEVQPVPEIDPGLEGPGGGGSPVETLPETFWGKVLRFFKGLLGLDSGIKQPVVPEGGEMVPPDTTKPIVVPKG